MQGDGIISRRVPGTAGAPERKGLTLPIRGVDLVPARVRKDGNLSGLPSLMVCKTTTEMQVSLHCQAMQAPCDSKSS